MAAFPLVAAFMLFATLQMTLNSSSAQEAAAVVDTTLGPIQGLRQTVLGKNIDVYYGVPFAKPPVGELRFKRPVPADPWTDTKSTVERPNSCFQSLDVAFDRFPGVEMWNPNTPMKEDCLYLNLWVPRGDTSGPRATMVWIFGGGFWAGTSTLDVYNGSNLAASENVVVASMNYRVGALGFLYTGTDDAPGNQGLLDQVLALKWIYDNVAKFGGSTDKITIFGESAGAASVGFHLMSPLSKNYFTRAIMQSSSPLVHWGVTSQSKATLRAQNLASSMGCATTPPDAMVNCLRGTDAQKLTDSMWNLIEGYFDVPIAPVVDDHFLTDHPQKLMERGEVKDTQVIIGAVKDEGMFWLLYGFSNEFPFDNSGTLNYTDFKRVAKGLNFMHHQRVTDALVYEYADSVIPSERPTYRDIADDMCGDHLFVCPVMSFAEQYAAMRPSHKVYAYLFDHRLSNNPWPAWMGVLHGYEIEAMFALPLPFDYTTEERNLSSRVTSYLTKFAESGDPNGDTEVWSPLTVDSMEYLRIHGSGDSVQKGYRYKECKFREHILPLLQDDTAPMDKADCPNDASAASSLVMNCFSLTLLILPLSI